MKFTASSSALSNQIQAIGRVISSRNTLPILECLLMSVEDKTLTITASDNETTLKTTVELYESDNNGDIAISSKTLIDALKEIPEQPLTFEINKDTYEVCIKYMNGMYNMVGQNPEEYPSPAVLTDQAVYFDIDSETLSEGITRSLFATAEDELRPVMNGIYFDITPDNLTFVASDGHKLVRNRLTSIKGKGESAFILPKKPASLLKSLLVRDASNVNIGFDERNAIFTISGKSMVCRLIEGRYPNYNSVIPQNNPNRLTIDRLVMLSALKRVAVFSSQSSSLVRLRIKDNELVISAQDIDFSTSAMETLTCQYEGNPMSIGFKSNFLIDILTNIPGQEIVIQLADPSRAGVIVPAEQIDDEDLLMLLMPMMLND
ncbi:MAG TPA: DNA polymerase III subunit beta [Bacteroidaceae bacterium]|nr:DNA polymerase III subunit beta [Bacteroidaceae bacterium]